MKRKDDKGGKVRVRDAIALGSLVGFVPPNEARLRLTMLLKLGHLEAVNYVNSGGDGVVSIRLNYSKIDRDRKKWKKESKEGKKRRKS